ncbi:LysM peptidoglycan-binding domain-containing protein [Streptomyces wuyuanensis]|uniref:LysM peptidoglycan-binding domain-containing protein n=1 Tax=Streptomyces wuyuanensis TaxID=1196353 RepID=UPI003422E80C
MAEPYETSPLDSLPGSHPYPRSSRYHDAQIGVHRTADGREVRYTRRRLLPPLPEDPGEQTAPHTVGSGERPDQLAQRHLGDPSQWWRIADANPVLDPDELTAEPGRVIAIPLPGGFPDGAGGGLHGR